MSVKCAECGSELEWTVWGTRPKTDRLRDAEALDLRVRRIVERAANMGGCSQTHHEHLSADARKVFAALEAAINEPDRAFINQKRLAKAWKHKAKTYKRAHKMCIERLVRREEVLRKFGLRVVPGFGSQRDKVLWFDEAWDEEE